MMTVRAPSIISGSSMDRDLAEKHEQLAILQAELTDRELFLESLRAELAAFEGRYLREVGVLYAELDEWNAKIAELTAEAVGTEQVYAALRPVHGGCPARSGA
jgi:hypothetical protein